MNIKYSYVDLKTKLKNRILNTEQDKKITKIINDVKNNNVDLSKIDKYIKTDSSIWTNSNDNLNVSLEID
jgi:hypothetical protein